MGKHEKLRDVRDNTALEQQVYGCLADVTLFNRYAKYLNSKNISFTFMEYWSEKDVNAFRNKVNRIFDIDLVISKKDKMNDIIKNIGGMI